MRVFRPGPWLFLVLCVARAHAQGVTVLLLDDVGRVDLDEVIASGWAPSLTRVARDGFEFRNAHAMPICQPTRRSLDFGNWDPRWVAHVCNPEGAALPEEDRSLAEAAGVPSLFLGKWHEGTNPGGGPWQLAPQAHGWGGWRGGVAGGVSACGGVDYFNWVDVEDGTATLLLNTYQPAVQYSRWEAWWGQERGPRLALYSTPLAHAPFQRPPNAWLPSGYPASPTPRARYKAMIVACDVALGRMLARMSPEDVVILVGDNGTPGELTPEPGRAKGTTFARGLDVPLIVYGRGFKGRSNALVHVTDVYATAIELLGGAPDPTRDSRSLVPLMLGDPRPVHDHVLCGTLGHEQWRDDVCVLSQRFKLRVTPAGQELYDLALDPGERTDVSADPRYALVLAQHLAWLRAELP